MHRVNDGEHRTGRRKRHEEETEREDRWVVSYADFVTLLFAFFTTMYAISHVDLGKLDRFSGSMKSAFSRAGASQTDTSVIDGVKPVSYDAIRFEQNVQTRLKKTGIMTGVDVSRDERGVTISIEDSLIFDSGSAEIKDGARQLLSEVAAVIRETANPVVIEGHTDNMPLRNSAYSSNWALSAARATSALVLLVNEYGVRPDRLSVAGYGEYRPVASNATAAGRAKNRRVGFVFVGTAEKS